MRSTPMPSLAQLTRQAREILEYLRTHPEGVRSDHLIQRWQRAQARIGELRRMGCDIRTSLCPTSGLAIYRYHGWGQPKGAHDLGLRITWCEGEDEPTGKPYAETSVTGAIPGSVQREAASLAAAAVERVLQRHGYLPAPSDDIIETEGGWW